VPATGWARSRSLKPGAGPGDTLQDRIASDPQRGPQACTRQTVAAAAMDAERTGQAATYAGFSRHAG